MLKFKEEKLAGLLGLTLVMKELGVDGNVPPQMADGFTILADSGGVRFTGSSQRISSNNDLDTFASAVAKAFKFFNQVRPKITNLAGH